MRHCGKIFSEFIISDNVKKICLPFYEPLFTAETPKIFVAGFGFVDEDGTKSNVMQAAVLEPSPFPICKEKFDEISNASLNNNLQFCAGGKSEFFDVTRGFLMFVYLLHRSGW